MLFLACVVAIHPRSGCSHWGYFWVLRVPERFGLCRATWRCVTPSASHSQLFPLQTRLQLCFSMAPPSRLLPAERCTPPHPDFASTQILALITCIPALRARRDRDRSDGGGGRSERDPEREREREMEREREREREKERQRAREADREYDAKLREWERVERWVGIVGPLVYLTWYLGAGRASGLVRGRRVGGGRDSEGPRARLHVLG